MSVHLAYIYTLPLFLASAVQLITAICRLPNSHFYNRSGSCALHFIIAVGVNAKIGLVSAAKSTH